MRPLVCLLLCVRTSSAEPSPISQPCQFAAAFRLSIQSSNARPVIYPPRRCENLRPCRLAHRENVSCRRSRIAATFLRVYTASGSILVFIILCPLLSFACRYFTDNRRLRNRKTDEIFLMRPACPQLPAICARLAVWFVGMGGSDSDTPRRSRGPVTAVPTGRVEVAREAGPANYPEIPNSCNPVTASRLATPVETISEINSEFVRFSIPLPGVGR